ncbi:hypothetical protein TNCV_565511 [Trichonephila clavipes]|nr:hypothetical protein TNCV_565511 [Trichonephila clavipes]
MCLRFVMWLRDPSLSCAQSACHHGQWCNQVSAIGLPSVRRFSPVCSDGRSTSQLLGFIQVLISLKDNLQALWATILPLSNSEA